MQTDHLWRFAFVEMAMHRIAYLLVQGFQIVRLGKDGCSKRTGRKTALGRILDKKQDFVHAMPLSFEFYFYSDSNVLVDDCHFRSLGLD